MKRKKENIRIFLRSATVTAVALGCIALVTLGIFESFEKIHRISFGKEQTAVSITKEGIRILDFEISFKNH